MQVSFYLLLLLHVTAGCRLERNEETTDITASTGDSVLLPCSCTDLHTTPETFTWEKYINENKWVEISPESEQYKERFQLVNDRSSGNLSLLISHLTEEDGADYRCSDKWGRYRDIRLTVKGCRLEGNKETTDITASTGDSVLLPCSCTDLHTTPETFTWRKYKTNGNDWVEISPESEQDKERFQLVNDRSSGNLSLLISHLTEEDGGDYMCSDKESQYRSIRLTVKDAPTKPSTSAPVTRTTSPHSKPAATKSTTVINNKTSAPSETPEKDHLPYVPFAAVTVFFLHIIVAVVYYTTRKKGPETVHYSRADGDGAVTLPLRTQ